MDGWISGATLLLALLAPASAGLLALHDAQATASAAANAAALESKLRRCAELEARSYNLRDAAEILAQGNPDDAPALRAAANDAMSEETPCDTPPSPNLSAIVYRELNPNLPPTWPNWTYRLRASRQTQEGS